MGATRTLYPSFMQISGNKLIRNPAQRMASGKSSAALMRMVSGGQIAGKAAAGKGLPLATRVGLMSNLTNRAFTIKAGFDLANYLSEKLTGGSWYKPWKAYSE